MSINLLEKYGMFILGILIGAICVIIAFLLFILIKKNKDNNNVQRKKNNNICENFSYNSKSEDFEDNRNETSVLSNDYGATCVLSGNLLSAMLIRCNTGEHIDITKQIFRLGKDKEQVDYCVMNNTNVSRLHASIVYRQGSYHLIDEKSTNGSFINGNRINPEYENLLQQGDIIRLANEEFEFFEYK